jgi:hypothetical protein
MAEGQRHHECDHQPGQAERERHRHAFGDQRGDAGLEEVAVAQVAREGVADPIEELVDERLVESVGLTHGLDVGLRGVGSGDGNREVAGQARQHEGQCHYGGRHEHGHDQAADEKLEHDAELRLEG